MISLELSLTTLVFWVLSAVSLVSAIAVVSTRDVTRMALALGAFLVSIAGWFVYFSQSFLGIAQLFVYVGGVLVLMLFAIMLLHRSPEGVPDLESRHSLDSALVAAAVFMLVSIGLRDVGPTLGSSPVPGTPARISGVLLGDMLPHFEALGVLLLAALAAVVAISGGERK